ncbi:LacI family transcriptional regulator [Streptomyces sp. NBC_00243]|uniref:LacI family DNA-binding transcriptional regulator n=1 Tax=Streptomyces sp. NBC_00243 TaxID=2975688 RepID=UPI002DDB7EAC|nr:LacI family DNA-binding transcriptional regulator [Streptomyces sp. NBC_00243]WRZ18868.1 LacI family transcriptional regulator [Streptomyces sp. NBC_00243]
MSRVQGRFDPPAGSDPRRVGIKDVARVAGVSPGTVSNVLNHPERVTAAKRLLVERAIKDLGFVRHESARHLRVGTSHTLGLLLLDAWNPFFTEMARGVEDWTFDRGWPVLVSNSARSSEREAAYLRLFLERRVAGLIVVPHQDSTEQLIDLRRQGIPSVVVDRAEFGEEGMSVALDDVKGGALAVDHLLDLGHRSIAFLGDPDTVTQVRDRLLGATRAIAESGTAVRFDVLPSSGLTVDGGRELGNRLVAMGPSERPTAVFASNDLLAIGVLQSLIQHGVHVPDEIALVGYDDIEFSRQVSVPLTTVRQPAYQMGRTAAEMITGQLAGSPPDPRHIVFEPELIVRESTTSRPS